MVDKEKQQQQLILFIAQLTRVMGHEKAGEKGFEFARLLLYEEHYNDVQNHVPEEMVKAAEMVHQAMLPAWDLVKQWQREEIASARQKRQEAAKATASELPSHDVRAFRLTWDTVRARNQRQRSREKQHATGIRFAETGLVALSSGQTFESVDSMEHTLQSAGEYEIEWL